MVTTTGVRIDAKGRLTIPREMRELLHIAPGDTVFLRADSDLRTIQLIKADNPFDILAEHALDEYRAGRTTSLDDLAKELGVELDRG